MASGDIMRLLVVTVFCVFGTRGLTTRKLSASVTTMPATSHETGFPTTTPSMTTGGATNSTATNTTTSRPDGLLNKYNVTAMASAASTASSSAAFLTNPPPLRQPVPETLTADPAQHGQAQHPTSQSPSSLHTGPAPNVIHDHTHLHGGPSVGSVPDTIATAMSLQTTPSPVAVPVQTETTVPNSSASVPGAVYLPTIQPVLTPGPASVPNTHAEASHGVSPAGSVGQHPVSGHPGVTATKSLTSTAHTHSSATLLQQSAPTQLSSGKAVDAVSTAAASPALTSSATGSSPGVTVIPYPCDGYNCPTDKPHCVLVRQQCKALRCPAIPTCTAVAPVTVQCLVGHPVYDDMFSALTCGSRGDYNCPIQSDCDETSGFATCCWTGSHGVNTATSKMEPTSYLLSAPNPRVQNPAPAPAGSCPVLGIGESCPSSTVCNSDSQCSYGSQCCFLSRTCRVCVNTVVGGTHTSGKGSQTSKTSSNPSATAIPGLFPSNDQRFKAGNSIGANSMQSIKATEINAASSVLTEPSPGTGQGDYVQINTASQGSSGISKPNTASGISSKATPQGSVVPQQQFGSSAGDLGRIRPGDLIVDILNHGANGSHAVISGMTNGGIVQLGRHRIGSVDGSIGTNGIGNGPSNSVSTNVDAMAVSSVGAAAFTDPSSTPSTAPTAKVDIGTAVTAATSSSANANAGGTGTTGGVVSDTSGSTISAIGASTKSAVVDRTLPISLDSLFNVQGSSSVNVNDVNSGTSGNVIGDVTLGGVISGSEASVSVASGPTVSPTVDAGPLVKTSTVVDPGVNSGSAAGSVGDIVSGGGGRATLGGADRHLTLATNSGGVSSNTVGTVVDASGNNGNGILNGQLVSAAGISGATSTGSSTPGISNLDTGLSTGSIIDQGVTGNDQVFSIGTGDLGNAVSGQVGATSQSVLLPGAIPDPQGGLSQVVLDSPIGVTDALGGNMVVGTNAVGGGNGVNAISPSGIDGIYTGISGTAIDQQGSIGNNPSGLLADGIRATAVAGNRALSGTVGATGVSLVPSEAVVVNAGSNSNTFQNANSNSLGASGSLLSNGITPSGPGSSGSFQTAGSPSHPRQPRFQVEIETTHFAPHLQSGRRISNVGGASVRRKHTSTSVKIGGGSNHFSTSVNIGHGGNSRQEVKINHNVGGRNGRHGAGAGNPRLQTSINIGSSQDGHPEIRKTDTMNAPRSQNYRQPESVNRETSRLPGGSSLRGVSTSGSGTSNRMNGITDQLMPGSIPSYLASGSGDRLRSSASRSATITKRDPFVRPRPSSLSRSTIAGSTASRAIAAGNIVVNGGVTGIRGVSRNPSGNTARSSPIMSGMPFNSGTPASVPGTNIGVGSNAVSGSNTLGLSEQAYSSATVGQYPVRSGSPVVPLVGNPGATHVDALGTGSGVLGTLNGLSGLSLAPSSDVLPGSDIGQFSSISELQGNTALGMSPTSPRTNNAGDYVPATSNVPPSSPTRSRGDLAGALKPSAFPLPTSYDAAANKPGFCLKPCGYSLCINECSHDSQCPGSQKCCSSGCGRVCSPPFPYIPTVKPGMCPSSPSSAVCTRGHSCSHDGECPGSSKCCCIGDGCRVCVLQVRSLPKMAPASVLAPQTLPQFGMIGKGYVWR